MSVECIFGDWSFSLMEAPWAAYRARDWLPLRWSGDKIVPVHPADGVAESIPYVALAAHWGRAHPGLLEALVGPFEMDGYPRSPALP